MRSEPLNLEVIVEGNAIDQHLGVLSCWNLSQRTGKYINGTFPNQLVLPVKTMTLDEGLIDEEVGALGILDKKGQILGFIEERFEDGKTEKPFSILLEKIGCFLDGFAHSLPLYRNAS